MTRRCSHCGHNGHNSRTCPNKGVKIFGVRLTDKGSMKKSASMGNLSHYNNTTGSNLSALLNNSAQDDLPGENLDHHGLDVGDGYGSEDFVASSSSSRERKKGIPWTEEEHRMFLLGLQKLGKGDWRGISRNYVISRTPTQVASHAQKYFIRHSNVSRRKRRSSLFDMVTDEAVGTPMASEDFHGTNQPQDELLTETVLPTPALEEDCESMDSTHSNDGETPLAVPDNLQHCYPVIVPTYFSPFFPFSFPYWVEQNAEPHKMESHEVLKPTAVHSKSPINVDELVGISKLSIDESSGNIISSSLSQKVLDCSNRPSAFHTNPASSSSEIDSSSKPISSLKREDCTKLNL